MDLVSLFASKQRHLNKNTHRSQTCSSTWKFFSLTTLNTRTPIKNRWPNSVLIIKAKHIRKTSIKIKVAKVRSRDMHSHWCWWWLVVGTATTCWWFSAGLVPRGGWQTPAWWLGRWWLGMGGIGLHVVAGENRAGTQGAR